MSDPQTAKLVVCLLRRRLCSSSLCSSILPTPFVISAPNHLSDVVLQDISRMLYICTCFLTHQDRRCLRRPFGLSSSSCMKTFSLLVSKFTAQYIQIQFIKWNWDDHGWRTRFHSRFGTSGRQIYCKLRIFRVVVIDIQKVCISNNMKYWSTNCCWWSVAQGVCTCITVAHSYQTRMYEFKDFKISRALKTVL